MTQRTRFVLIGTFALFVIPFVRVHADSSTSTSSGTSIVEQIGCDETVIDNATGKVTINRACQLTDFINLFVYLSKWGFSILAMLSVGMMIYGGTQFITAAGRSSKVDEGKRVINGTIIGTIIALTAYIIINSTVTAVSGTTLASSNPFGVIATVFGNSDPANTINGQTIKRPFSGTGSIGTGSGSTGDTVLDCRKDSTTWDRVDSAATVDGIQITKCSATNLSTNCSDPGTTGRGPITQMQEKLQAKNCDCGGTADGCFGPKTARCVQMFQIANQLPATGVINATTRDMINNASAKGCDDAVAVAVTAKLPSTTFSTASNSDIGCCIVNDGANDLYCLDNVSTRACQALGTSNTFLGAPSGSTSGKCAAIPAASGRCGFCSNTPSTLFRTTANKCFQGVSKYWCTNVATNNIDQSLKMNYFNGSCDGSCASCSKALVITPK